MSPAAASHSPPQGRLGLDQLKDGVCVGRQVREPRQVGVDLKTLARLDPHFHLLVHQLQEHHLPVRASLGSIHLDRRPFAAQERLTERLDHTLDFSPGHAFQLGS